MKFISIFNDVLGPIMRGPSSSHTAGSYHISTIVRELMGREIKSATITFAANGSYAKVYQQQGADLAFAAGLLKRPLSDPHYFHGLQSAKSRGMEISFAVRELPQSNHPNTVQLSVSDETGTSLEVQAQSVGGGMVEITHLQGRPVHLNGKAHEVVAFGDQANLREVREHFITHQPGAVLHTSSPDSATLQISLSEAPDKETLQRMAQLAGIDRIWHQAPLFRPQQGQSLFEDTDQLISIAEEKGWSLGKIALAHESSLLGISEEQALSEMDKRLAVMEESIANGMDNHNAAMQLLAPSAAAIMASDSAGELPIGGLHTRAAARALAVMHCSNSGGLVCAAPTGGSAGTIPGIITTVAEAFHLPRKKMVLGLFAAGAIGAVIARRATFAAEVAGCQVEIGAATAMGAAATIEMRDGTARQGADAAAISLQNTMGSVCDLVQGICEIPCHTRNGIGASSALVCADLIQGGYHNPIPLDETIDAVYSVGKMLPDKLRCTALGGLAITPSAQKMKPPGTLIQDKKNKDEPC